MSASPGRAAAMVPAPVERSQLRGHRQRSPNSAAPTVGQRSMSSSLSRFSGWRSRSLSLGEGLPDSTGARDGTRADGVLDRGRRRLFSFWRYCLAAPSSYRVDRGRHLALSAFAGVSQCRALSPDFPAGARGLYPLARGCRNSTGARDGTRADGGLDRGRRRLFSFWCYCLAAPSSYRVDRGRHLALSAFAGVSQCRALSPDFPAGARGLYPLARGCRIRPARGMAPALMVCWIEGGAGFFLFGVIAWRRRRATGSIAAGTWRCRHSPGCVCGVLSLRHFRLASWCSLSLGGGWPRIRRGAVSNKGKTRRLLTNRPCSSLSTKSPIPTNVYASAIGLCTDSIIMQSRKPSNSDF